ncbi:hypothetical protein BY458DRAFT_440988 [Sporodiniella umbellata]|nr:hypothetical protein BY458DRAFT_440988 [Sporodiniella umbellata]
MKPRQQIESPAGAKNNGRYILENLDESFEKTSQLIKVLAGLIISWNVNDALETTCSQFVKPTKTLCRNTSYGLRGSNGYLSLMAPVKHEKSLWEISSSISTVRLLSISLLLENIISKAGEESRYIDLITGYFMSLPLVIGKNYCFPSLLLLSKYWQDPTARSLFTSTLDGISKQDLDSALQHWERLSGCDRPNVLSPSICRSTALSLTTLLANVETELSSGTLSSVSISQVLSSIELLSQGFKTWEKYLNGTELLRTLFTYASDSSSIASSFKNAAINAIFRISISNMPLVVSTLTMDIVQSKSLDLRLRCLKVVEVFVKKEPIVLYPYVHNVIEAIVKTLDPNVPHMREEMIHSATSILHSLVTTYPTIDFSTGTQKLAIGTSEGASVIYDLRTATRSVVLEGHTGPIAALAFSPDAKLIATCSLYDQSVRIWHTNMSLFDMIASSLTLNGQQNKSSSGTHKADRSFEFALPNSKVQLCILF